MNLNRLAFLAAAALMGITATNIGRAQDAAARNLILRSGNTTVANVGTLGVTTLTAPRSYTFPDKDGTILVTPAPMNPLSVLRTNALGDIETVALTDGQLLIGATGGLPTAATLTGTTNQVSVTNAANSITLSLPQDIHTGASPTFLGLTITDGPIALTTTGANDITVTVGGDLKLVGIDALAPITDLLWIDGSNNVRRAPFTGTAAEGVEFQSSAYRLGGQTNATNPLTSNRFVNIDDHTLTFTSAGGVESPLILASDGTNTSVTVEANGTGTFQLITGTGLNVGTTGDLSSAAGAVIVNDAQGLNVQLGGVDIDAGGLNVDAGGATITGATTLTTGANELTITGLAADNTLTSMLTLNGSNQARTTALNSVAWLVGGNTFTGGSTYTIGTNSADNLAFETGGTNQMILETDGDLGIGTATAGAPLHVARSVSGGAMDVLFMNSAAVGTINSAVQLSFANDNGASTTVPNAFIRSENTGGLDNAATLYFGTWDGTATGWRMSIAPGGAVTINSGAANDLTISETTISRTGNIAVNPGAGNDITTDGGITSAENVTITSGGLTVTAGGANVTGTTSINTAAAVNTTTIGNNTAGNTLTVNSPSVTLANLPVGTGDVFVMSNAGALETRTISNIVTGTGTNGRMTRWGASNTLQDASLDDDGAGVLSRAGNISINPGAGATLSTNGSLTVAVTTTLNGAVNAGNGDDNVNINAGTGTFQLSSTGLNVSTAGVISDAGGDVEVSDNLNVAGTVTINSGGANDLTISETTISRTGNIAVNPGTGNDITTDGGITSAENVTISSGGLTVNAGGVDIDAGGLNVDAGGATIVGTTSINTTAAANTTTIGNNTVGNSVAINAPVVTMANLPAAAATANVFIVEEAGEIRKRTITGSVLSGTGTDGRMTRWGAGNTLQDASLNDDGAGTLSRTGSIAINPGTGNDITTDGGITSAENVTITSGGLTVTAGGANITGATTLATGASELTITGLAADNTLTSMLTLNGSNQVRTTALNDVAWLLGGNTLTAAATIGSNSAHNVEIEANGTTRLTIESATATVTAAADIVPSAHSTYDLGTDAVRWQDVYVDGTSVHIGPTGGQAANTELAIGYAGSAATFNANAGATTELTLGTDAVTVEGATNINNDANFATNINTGTSTGAVTIGGGAGTVAIASTGLNVSTAGVISDAGGDVEVGDNLNVAGTVTINSGGANDLTISETSISRTGNIAVNPGTGNDITTDGGITSAENVTISSGGLTVNAGGVDIDAGGLNVDAGGATVVGTTSINTTAAANTTTIGNNTVGNSVAINAPVVTMTNLPAAAATANVFIVEEAGEIRKRTITGSVLSGTGTDGRMTRWGAGNTLQDASLNDDGAGTLSRTGSIAINPGAGNDITTNGGITSAENVTITTGGLTVTAGGVDIDAGGLNVDAGGATVVGVTSINNNANNNTDINTGTSTGAVTIGGGAGTVAIASTGLNVTTAGVISDAGGDVEVGDNLNVAGTVTINSGGANDLTISETTISRTGNIAINPGTGNDITTDGGITSAENVTITSGGLTVTAGGANITGATTLATGASELTITGLAADNTLTSMLTLNGSDQVRTTALNDVAWLLGGNTLTAAATIGSNSAHNVEIEANGTTRLTIESGSATVTAAADIVPSAHSTYDLGTDAVRWRDVYVDGSSLHIGPTGGQAASTELAIGYAGSAATFNANTGATTELTLGTDAVTVEGATNINNDANFATNINTGTSTGAVTIGNAGSGGVVTITSSLNTDLDAAAQINLGASDATAVTIGNTSSSVGITGTTLTAAQSGDITLTRDDLTVTTELRMNVSEAALTIDDALVGGLSSGTVSVGMGGVILDGVDADGAGGDDGSFTADFLAGSIVIEELDDVSGEGASLEMTAGDVTITADATVSIQGGRVEKVEAVNAAHALLASDYIIIQTADADITLPTTPEDGRTYIIRNQSVGAIDVIPDATESINDLAAGVALNLAVNTFVKLVFLTDTWYTIGN